MPTTRSQQAGTAAYRVADMQLRDGAGLLPARVYWPAPTGVRPPLLVSFGSPDATLERLCMQAGVVVLAASHRSGSIENAAAVIEWAADHAAELDADPGWLFVGGEGAQASLAATAVLRARDAGWPPIIGQVLIFRGEGIAHPPALPTIDVAPAIVVTVGGEEGEYQGERYAFRLRLGGVPVEQLHYECQAQAADRLLTDLAASIRRAVG
jgi:acetyl esterase/lipase